MVLQWLCVQLVLGDIIGMSFIDSIFVDAMVSDNNDEVEAKLDELNRKLDKLTEELKKKNI